MFTAHLDVDKLYFKLSIALHVAHGYHIYCFRQVQIQAFSTSGISFRILISENFQQELQSL